MIKIAAAVTIGLLAVGPASAQDRNPKAGNTSVLAVATTATAPEQHRPKAGSAVAPTTVAVAPEAARRPRAGGSIASTDCDPTAAIGDCALTELALGQ